MVQAKTLTQNTTYYTLALVFQKVLAFVYFTFLARGLGVEDLGRYTFAFSFTTIFSVFVDVGLNSVLTREIAKDRSRTKEILANVLGIKLFLSLFVYLFVVILINLMDYPEITKNLVYLTGVIMLLDTFSNTFWGVLRGHQNLKYESAGIVFFESLVIIVGAILLILDLGVVVQVLAVLMGSSFLCFFSYWEMRRRTHLIPTIQIDRSLAKKLLIIAWPFALTGILARLNTQIDTIFLSKIGCATQAICDANVGIYSVATKIILAIHFLPLAFVAALFPALSEFFATDQEKLARTFEKAMRYLMFISAPIAGGLLILAPDFVPQIFGREYYGAILPLQILAGSLIFLFLTFPIGSLLNACSKQLQNTKQIGVAVAVNTLLNIFLIPRLTYVGGAISSLVSTVVLFVLGIYATNKILKYNKKYLLTSFLQSLLAGIIMVFVLWLLLFKIHFIYLIILGALVYFLALFLFGFFTRQELNDILLSLRIKKSL
ncbi:MAG TPA: flippase [bacterium]|nr:flippase [bacterium]HPL95534.1 flippase [bacterium]